MPKIRYSAKENKRVGTHSFYAQAIPTGKPTGRGKWHGKFPKEPYDPAKHG